MAEAKKKTAAKKPSESVKGKKPAVKKTPAKRPAAPQAKVTEPKVKVTAPVRKRSIWDWFLGR